MNMKKLFLLVQMLDKQDVLHNTYYDVEFLEDFGSFKKGEKFSSINVNYGSGVIEVR
jgi:hypothetical protein